MKRTVELCDDCVLDLGRFGDMNYDALLNQCTERGLHPPDVTEIARSEYPNTAEFPVGPALSVVVGPDRNIYLSVRQLRTLLSNVDALHDALHEARMTVQMIEELDHARHQP
jgi:hypothetical protein